LKKMKYTRPKAAARSPDEALDVELVEALAKILTRLGLSEIEIAQGDIKIRVARQFAAAVQSSAPAAAAPPTVGAAPPGAASEWDMPGAVKSPMVGTAYRRASPDAPPFVEVGSVVKAGDKLLLVEAMKTFNEIVAPRAGTVTRVLVEDGQPVEYGQPLFMIE
jgi:acetyl-CoA carboxylase biotin carboxyl carrier protein